MKAPCSLHQFSLVKEHLGVLLQSVMMLCCVLTQGLCLDSLHIHSHHSLITAQYITLRVRIECVSRYLWTILPLAMPNQVAL